MTVQALTVDYDGDTVLIRIVADETAPTFATDRELDFEVFGVEFTGTISKVELRASAPMLWIDPADERGANE